jgi:hypothetical protein
MTERALAARIRRKLAQEMQSLHWDRSGQLGWYIVNDRINGIVAQGCDLVELAKELECIRPWERLSNARN